MKADAPSPEAFAAFQRQVGLWRSNPEAGLHGGGELLCEVWADWLQSPHAPPDKRLVAAAGRLLFGTPAAPKPHARTPVAAFAPADLLDWQSELCGVAETRKGRGTGPRYGRRMVMRLVGLVKRCFQWAAVRGRVASGLAAEVRLVEGPAKGEARRPARVPAVPDERVAATLPCLPPPVAAAVRVLRLCGARPEEVLTLAGGDIVRGGVCWAAGAVPLDLDALGVWAAVKGGHKNEWRGDDRVIFFGPLAQAALAPLLSPDDPARPLFRPADGRAHAVAANRAKRKPGGYGSYKRPKGAAGRPLNPAYTTQSFLKAVTRGCERAGVPRWTPKQLRKTCLALVQARFGAEAARAVGGHAAAGVTQEFYTGLDFTLAARAMAELG